MNVKEAREIVLGMELSVEARSAIDKLLVEFGEGELTNEAIDKILKIIDIEMDATKLAADVYEAGTQMVNKFLKTVDDEAGKITDEIDEDLAKGETGQ